VRVSISFSIPTVYYERTSGVLVCLSYLTLFSKYALRRENLVGAMKRAGEWSRPSLQMKHDESRASNIAWKAQIRLCARYRRLSNTGKKLPWWWLP
jgi:hypothetical protein